MSVNYAELWPLLQLDAAKTGLARKHLAPLDFCASRALVRCELPVVGVDTPKSRKDLLRKWESLADNLLAYLEWIGEEHPEVLSKAAEEVFPALVRAKNHRHP